MSSRGASTEQRDRGVFAFVAAIVVAAAVLSSAGVIGSEPPAPEPSRSPPPAASAARGPEAVPGDRREQDAATEGATPGGERAEVLDAPALELPVEVRRAFVGRHTHYTGSLTVLADGMQLSSTELVDSAALRCAIRTACRELEFVAPGHAPAVLDVAEARTKKVAQVVLQPDVGFAVELRGVPPDAKGTWFLAVQTEHLDNGTCEHPLDANREATRVPLVAGVPFGWQATLQVDARRVHFGGKEPALASGEWRPLVLDFGAKVTQRYRVVGPSAELLSHIRLRYSWNAGGVARGDEATLAADGSCELGADLTDFAIGDVALRSEGHGAETWLLPQQPLVGVGLRDTDGKPVVSNAFAADGEIVSFRRELHVLARERVEVGVSVGDRRGGDGSRVDASTLRGRGDVVWLSREAAPAVPTGTLRLLVQGMPTTREPGVHVKLNVRGGDGQRRDLAPEASIDLELPAGRSYDVSWSLPGRGVDGPKGCDVRAGTVTSVAVSWPQFEVWTGEVVGLASMPKERRWRRLAWGDGNPWQRGTTLPRDDARFQLSLLAGEQLGSGFRLGWAAVWVPARATITDAARREFRVEPIGAVRWVEVDVQAPAPWFVAPESPSLEQPPFPIATHDNRIPIPVVAGQALHGALLQGQFGPSQRTIAWWTIRDGDDVLRVQASAGRWIELKPAAASANRVAVLVGPHGQRDMGIELTSASPRRVWVPDGTRGIGVFDGYVIAGTWREIPLGSSDVVVID